METISNYHRQVCCGYEKERLERLLSEGYEIENELPYGVRHIYLVKEYKLPAYSAHCNPKMFSKSKYNSEKSQTYYYNVNKVDFDNLEEKPTLHEVVRPMELTNFDWYAPDVTANEKRGLGWEETYYDKWNVYHRNIYFIN